MHWWSNRFRGALRLVIISIILGAIGAALYFFDVGSTIHNGDEGTQLLLTEDHEIMLEGTVSGSEIKWWRYDFERNKLLTKRGNGTPTVTLCDNNAVNASFSSSGDDDDTRQYNLFLGSGVYPSKAAIDPLLWLNSTDACASAQGEHDCKFTSIYIGIQSKNGTTQTYSLGVILEVTDNTCGVDDLLLNIFLILDAIVIMALLISAVVTVVCICHHRRVHGGSYIVLFPEEPETD